MSNYQDNLLRNIFVAQVATLAKAIKAEKLAQGTRTTSDCYREAIIEIKRNREKILSLLDEIQAHY